MKRYTPFFTNSSDSLPNLYFIRFTIDEYSINIYFDYDNQQVIHSFQEAKNKGPIIFDSQYSARKDQRHSDKGQIHLHLFMHNNEIAAVNKDGSGHDGSHGYELPKKVYNGIKTKFPDFKIKQIIESATSLNPILEYYDFDDKNKLTKFFD